NERGAIAVVNVQVDDRDALDPALLQTASRDCDVVEWTEPFAVVRKRVVQAAADVTRNAELARLKPRATRRVVGGAVAARAFRRASIDATRQARRIDRSADHQPK